MKTITMNISRQEYQKQYRENHKEKTKIYNEKYHQKNKEKLNQYHKNWSKQNKLYLKTYVKKYWSQNKDRRRKISNRYRISHKDLMNQRMNSWRQKNPEKQLQINKRHLEKYGFPSDIKNYKIFKYALATWSKVIQKRQNNLCAICNNPSEITHHLIYKSVEPKLSLNLNNGIALCKKCHHEVHGWGLKSSL